MRKLMFIMESLAGGGAERAMIELLNNFDYTKYSVTLCVIFGSGIYTTRVPSQVQLINIFVDGDSSFRVSLKERALASYRKRGSTWLMNYLIKRKVRQRKYDAIVSFMEGYPVIFHSLICGWSPRNISWIHCDLSTYHWTRNFFRDLRDERYCYEKMDELVFVSSNAMKAFEYLYDISVPKECIYNVIDVERIRGLAEEFNVTYDRLTITLIGSLYKVKGYDRIIRVAKMLKDDGYSFRVQILGNGEELEALTQLKNEMGVSEEVSFLSFRKNPYPYLKQSDIFVSSSLSEGLPLVICEALALGVPVVATKTAGSMELLDDGKYGVLAEQDDHSLYEAIKKLMDDIELRDYYREKAGARAKIFEVQQTMQKVYNIIDGK